MKKKSKALKPWLQILIGVGFLIWGGTSLYYQMQPGVIGIKAIPIMMLLVGAVNLYSGIKRSNNPEKFIGAETEKEVAELVFSGPKAEENIDLNEVTKKSELYKFLFTSYEQWRNGFFDQFSDYYKKAATKDSPEILAGRMLNDELYNTFLKRCFRARIPESNEVLYTISPSNFLITNRHLYIAPDLKQDKLHTMDICEIIAYKNKGLWMKSGSLRLKNGKEIQFKLEAVPDEKKVRQLQEMLNCEKLIEI